jgi:hypothetical protein
MNKRLVFFSLVGLVLALSLGYLNTQVPVLQRFFFMNSGTTVWTLKSLLNIAGSSATLFYVLLFVGFAGLGKD